MICPDIVLFSIGIALSMLYEGTGGRTREQLKTALRFPDPTSIQENNQNNFKQKLKKGSSKLLITPPPSPTLIFH